MQASVVVCIPCRRVIGVGVELPAVCLAEVPADDLERLTPGQAEAHSRAHTNCFEIPLDIPEHLTGDALIHEIEVTRGIAIAAAIEAATAISEAADAEPER